MFNKISNDSKVPNSYIYTSHTGSEYIFLEGAWYNADTMLEIPSSKNYKMNESALNQIEQTNKHSTLKIGQKYAINENQYVYIGRGRMTLDGMLLTESRNSQVVTVMEAEGEGNSIPTGYIYTSSKGKKYFKKDGKWLNQQTKQPVNTSAALSLERAAQDKIKKYNETAVVKIGQEWISNDNKKYRYAGDNRWISEAGKMLPATFGKSLVDYFEAEEAKKNPPADDSVPPPSGSSEPPVPPAPPYGNPPPVPPAPRSEPPAAGDGSDSLPKDVDALAEIIKNHPKKRKIQILLTRGDKLSLMAADILLSNQDDEAKKILKSLNNEEN